jgi:xanthine dehydrogenase iron-sulfur cluster and FAD-binding subunit A
MMHEGDAITTVEGLDEPCGPSDDDVRELMSGNLCRCGAYPNIVAAPTGTHQGVATPTGALPMQSFQFTRAENAQAAIAA